MNEKQFTKEDAHAALRAVLLAIVKAVKGMGEDGMPSSHMYAATMQFLSLDRYETVMATLVEAGKLRKSGHVYFWVADL